MGFIPGMRCRKGKVREIYEFKDWLVLVSTDSISAFDWVLPTCIPDKGRVLNKLSEFWFNKLGKYHHMISTNIADMPLPSGMDTGPLEGRSMLVRKAKVVPIECVVRGYLVGSGWKEYQKDGTVCGLKLPSGLRQADKLPEPIFTPATKAETGHDENISFDEMCDRIGKDLALQLRFLSLTYYARGSEYARELGIIIADTKFEFGVLTNEDTILIDEVLTPDSSRFWPVDLYQPGGNPPSFDKQFVRDWLEQSGWDKNSPPPPLPKEIVMKTREKYIQAYECLTLTDFPWK